MKLDDGMESVPTYSGVVSSFLLLLLFIAYAALKSEVLYSKDDTDIF